VYILDVMNVHETARRTERQMPCHHLASDDDQETPINRGIHYRPAVNTPPQPTMDNDHYLEIVDMPTDTDQVSTTDTDHYDKPDELPYKGLDATTATPPVVQQQPSVYEDLRQWITGEKWGLNAMVAQQLLTVSPVNKNCPPVTHNDNVAKDVYHSACGSVALL